MSAPEKAKINRLWRSHSADVFRWMEGKGFIVEFPPGQAEVPHGRKKTCRYTDGYTDAKVAALYSIEFPNAPTVFASNITTIRKDYFGEIYRAAPVRASRKVDLEARVHALEIRLLSLERDLGVVVDAPPKANGAHKSPA